MDRNILPFDYQSDTRLCSRWLFSITAGLTLTFLLFYIAVRGRFSAVENFHSIIELGYVELEPKRTKPKPLPPKNRSKAKQSAPVKHESAPEAPENFTVPPASEKTLQETEQSAEPVRPKTGPIRLNKGKQLDNVDFSPLFTPKPEYPTIAKNAGIQGYVDVDLLIDEDGRVKKFSIVSVSGHPAFGNKVAKVIPRWRFPPPRHEGEKVSVKYLYRVNFRLD